RSAAAGAAPGPYRCAGRAWPVWRRGWPVRFWRPAVLQVWRARRVFDLVQACRAVRSTKEAKLRQKRDQVLIRHFRAWIVYAGRVNRMNVRVNIDAAESSSLPLAGGR